MKLALWLQSDPVVLFVGVGLILVGYIRLIDVVLAKIAGDYDKRNEQ